MQTTNTTQTEWTEGQRVRFYLGMNPVIGEILRATPSTQTIYYAGRTYDVHGSKLTLVESAQ